MEHQTLSLLLAAYLLVSLGLAISYLFYRRCSALEFALWAALAFCIPVLGPFFIIAARPGPRKRSPQARITSRVVPSPKG